MKPEEREYPWFFSDENNFHQDQKVNLRNNKWLCVDADAYVETLQTIIKSSWIDSMASGGGPNVFQQDSPPSDKALKTQGWMDSQEFSSSCRTKLMAAS
ncbi:hypothetical protein ACTXT7_017255 [Hymenolepis weldensis]